MMTLFGKDLVRPLVPGFALGSAVTPTGTIQAPR
jgi:hypothetical protein